MDDFRLTEHFHYSEFVRSGVAELFGIDNNVDSAKVMVNLLLVARCIEVFRSAYGMLRSSHGMPLVITSGFRCSELNGILLGSPTSYHLQGLAVDFSCPDNDHRSFVDLLDDMNRHYPNLIKEEVYNDGYVHVAFDYHYLLEYFGDA